EGLAGQTLVPPGLADGHSQEREQRSHIVWLGEGGAVMGYRRLSSTPGGERVAGGGRGKGNPGVELCQQPGRGNAQGTRQAKQRQHRHIAPPLFDLGDIGVMDARLGGECSMGETRVLSVLTEGRPKALERRVWRA